MKENLDEGLELIQQGNYQEAYDYFNQEISQNENNVGARYYRALVNFMDLKKDATEAEKDFSYIVTLKRKPYYYNSCGFLTLLLDQREEYVGAIATGTLALSNSDKLSEDMIEDVTFVVARSYLSLGDGDSTEMAIHYFDECIAMDTDSKENYEICKMEALIINGHFEEAEKELTQFQINNSASGNLYFVKAKLYFGLAKKNESDASLYYDKALDALDICEKYDINPSLVQNLRLDIYESSKRVDEALRYLTKIENPQENKEAWIVDSCRFYQLVGNIEEIKRLCCDYLENNSSWKIAYCYAYNCMPYVDTEEKLQEVKKYLNFANKMAPDKDFIVMDLLRANQQLGYFEENKEIIMEHLAKNEKDGTYHYLYADTLRSLDASLDEQIVEYKKAYQYGYLNEIEMFDCILCIEENPEQYQKRLQFYAKPVEYKKLGPNSQRKMGNRYLDGLDGFKKDLGKGLEILKECARLEPKDTCFMSSLARAYQKNGDKESALNILKEGYELYLHTFKPDCNCVAGYYSYCLCKDFPTTENEELAKKTIQMAIQQAKIESSNIVIYMYSYFALQKEDGFSLELAKTYLESNQPFCRYEATRLVLLKKIYFELNELTLEKEEFITNQTKLVIKHSPKDAKEYFKQASKQNDLFFYETDF